MKTQSRFFVFNQNNSGGNFSFDEEKGITHYVIIEAKSKVLAVKKALEIGIYFNGCDIGKDCSCCGDRWYEPYGDGDKNPVIYGNPFKKAKHMIRWMKKGKEICVHYLSGKKAWA